MLSEHAEKTKMDDSHTKSGEECLNYFKVDEETGLDDNQVRRNQEKYGLNGENDIIHGLYAF